ncbi:adhesion G protein-coupled receptor L4 [Aplochiton taeniatus]
MDSLLKSPMKLVLLAAWLSSVIDPCRLFDICDSCHPLATCKNLNGSHACYCNHGYTGDGTSFCNDDNECQNVTNICGEKAECTNTEGSYYCTCVSGFTSSGPDSKFQPNDGTECIDIDECQQGLVCGPSSHCHNTNGSFFCTCQRDYIPTSGSKRFHPLNGEQCKEHPQKNCHDDTECISQAVNRTLEHVRNRSTSAMWRSNQICDQMRSLTQPERLLWELVKQTSGELTTVDVISNVEALALSSSMLSSREWNHTSQPAFIKSTLTNWLKAVNNLVEKDEMVAWNRMKEERREHTITKLLHAVEETTLTLATDYQKDIELEIKDSQLELKLFSFDVQRSKKRGLSVTMAGDHINLTPKYTNTIDRAGSVSVVFLRYDSVSDLLKPRGDLGVTDYTPYAEPGEVTVNTPVIAAAIHPADVYQLDHVTFTLRHTEPIDTKVDLTECAFWEYQAPSLQGRWATRGCERVHVNSTTTSCSCNHLTHFAILMSSGRAKLDAHYNVLTRITQLGMIISIICLSMCIFTFWFFSEIQSTRTTIHKNLCCSLFMAEFIFLVGINMNTHKLFCSIVAGLLHYFFLAAFAWMCIEGIHLYLIVVGVIYNKGFLHRNFYIFGYGSPAVVVAISATLGSKYYGTNKVCWLSTENNFIWSFIGPACLIILVNLLAFVVIIYKVYRHTSVKKPEISHFENIRSCARGALALLFVLGATWTFGVLHILNETTLTAYLFTITNAFQGMFIFIFLCVLPRKIQEEYYRLFKNVPCCFECLR